jgi:class 3 adenylate cyclase
VRNIMQDKALRHIPVIMLSALDEIDNVIKCIEGGAVDYLAKPFNPILLNARIGASLEKKRLRDHERDYMEILQIERDKSERLLLNVMPPSIADRLKQGESTIADSFSETTVMFANIADFARVTNRLSPMETVELLNDIFSQFDWLTELHGLEKIKTVADTYIVVGGLPAPRSDHASAVAEMALEMLKVIKRFSSNAGCPLNLRIGLSTGPVVAGVIGRKKFVYDLWGETVKVASLMEANSPPGAIVVSPATYDRLREKYQFKPFKTVELKGKDDLATHFLTGRLTRSPFP